MPGGKTGGLGALLKNLKKDKAKEARKGSA